MRDALDPAETRALLRERIGDGLLATTDEYRTFTVTVDASVWVETARRCRDEPLLAYDLFDCLFGVDAGDDGFDVVTVLYATSTGRRILLRTRAVGGRDRPSLPSITPLYAGANWMERETWDMFGIEFTDHPGLAPRLLTVENFEGWPLRKDFHLAARSAKAWPGVKEPVETDEDGNVVVREPAPGEAPGPSGLDKLMASQAAAVNATSEPDAHDTSKVSAPERVQIQPDQDTYDRLIAEGKSERVARSRAKAAAVKAERTRSKQAQQRADMAGRAPSGAADAAPSIPEGTPPPADADEPEGGS